jgi:hypothetical protein
MEASELQKFPYLFNDGSVVGASGHRHASAPTKVEEPFIAQDAQGAQHRVRVHAEHRRQVLGGRQSFAGRRFTGGDGVADLRGHLIVKSDVFRAVDLDIEHGAMHSSTMNRPTSLIDAPATAEALIPEARQRQRRRYRRSAVFALLVALLVGVLVALLITATSSGSGPSGNRSNASLAATPGRGTELIRPVLCTASPFAGAQRRNGPLPQCGARYAMTSTALSVTPTSASKGYVAKFITPDPALTGYPNSTSDAPGHVVLLGGLTPGSPRYLLGPSEMRLSASDVESASAHKNALGEWVVNVRLSAHGATLWDYVAHRNFHRFLAIDLDGNVVSASIIQPTQASFSSANGVLEVSGSPSGADARALAAAAKQ